MKTTVATLLIGLICLNNYSLSAQNAPMATIGSVETYESTVSVPITVTEFSNIGACDLLFNYDPTIAIATSVTLGPGIGAYVFLPNIQTPGIISFSWLFFQYGVPGQTLPDNSVFLNITFERVGYGYSVIEFDNSLPNNCLWTDDNYDELNDTPHSTYYIDGSLSFEMIDAPHTSVADIEDCEGSASIDIPVTVSNFNQIGALNLTMQYDEEVYSYQSFTNESGFPGLEVNESNPGTIIINGSTDTPEGFAIENNSLLCTIHFNNLGGSTTISWFDSGESCLFNGPAPGYEPRNDQPQSTFYMNGSFTELSLPDEAGIVTGPAGGTICSGTSGVVFSISPIACANTYEWTLPEGAVVESGDNTHEISVSFSENAISGDISVYGINECGNGLVSPSFPITIETAPAEAGIVAGPEEGFVCRGANDVTFSLSPISNATSYDWTLPAGATIDSGEGTHEISVSFSENAISGDVSVYGINECGNGMVSPTFPITVEIAPSIDIQPVSPDTVIAGSGTASFSVTAIGADLTYQWQEFTDDWANVSDGGVYSGSSTSLLTITNPPISMDGNFYRCTVSGNCEPTATTDGNAILAVVIYTRLANNYFDNKELKFKSFPNPFSEQISFTFVPPSKGTVIMEIANIYGEKVRTVTKEITSIEDKSLTTNTNNLKPGIYIATIIFDNKNTIMRNTLKIIAKPN